MKSIEALSSGLNGIRIIKSKGEDGKVHYDDEFIERPCN